MRVVLPFREVLLGPNLVFQMYNECIRAGRNETGGPLAGYQTPEGELVVVDAGRPGPSSRVTPMSVYLSGPDTISWLESVCADRVPPVWYVGDWHMHTRPSTRPSRKDVEAMRVMSEYTGYRMRNPVSIICHLGNSISSEQLMRNTAVYVLAQGRLRAIRWRWLQDS